MVSWTGVLILVLVLLVIVGVTFVQIRGRLRVQPKPNWLLVEATIQPGGLGTIVKGRQNSSSYAACFLGYGFEAAGMRRAGLFALFGDDGIVRMVYKDLPGNSIKVLYDPANPDNSALQFSGDPRFQGLNVTQDPMLLEQAPSFDLKDVIGR